MSKPLVPLCLVHTTPHPCVECNQSVGPSFFRPTQLADVELEPVRDDPRCARGHALGSWEEPCEACFQPRPRVRLKRFHPRAVCPEYAKPGDAGADLRAVESVRLRPFEPVKVRLGVGIELPPGYEAQLRGRSGLSSQGVHVEQGTIDQGYRGELSVVMILLNRGYSDYEVHIGDKRWFTRIVPEAHRARFATDLLG